MLSCSLVFLSYTTLACHYLFTLLFELTLSRNKSWCALRIGTIMKQVLIYAFIFDKLSSANIPFKTKRKFGVGYIAYSKLGLIILLS